MSLKLALNAIPKEQNPRGFEQWQTAGMRKQFSSMITKQGNIHLAVYVLAYLFKVNILRIRIYSFKKEYHSLKKKEFYSFKTSPSKLSTMQVFC